MTCLSCDESRSSRGIHEAVGYANKFPCSCLLQVAEEQQCPQLRGLRVGAERGGARQAAVGRVRGVAGRRGAAQGRAARTVCRLFHAVVDKAKAVLLCTLEMLHNVSMCERLLDDGEERPAVEALLKAHSKDTRRIALPPGMTSSAGNPQLVIQIALRRAVLPLCHVHCPA